ncbi:hypothetical protein C8A03DRAFT_33297 [Achaetomium macrosporum]|uniref:Zn(2)-C6 fungal-type domain-containing protein n=1 Tax=Achaetomium macrosporum TaxID=79813 RepID=A0AAN7HBG6_9PEZI|nr:hypothetical protein C8A03DRAFT_33297 [Achaetomium macrosporum]
MFGTWRFDSNPENDTLTQQPVDPVTARPQVPQACQSCREKKIRCSSEKSGCARCKTLSKPCVYTQRGEGKRPPKKRNEAGRQRTSSTGKDATANRQTSRQYRAPSPPREHPKSPQTHHAASDNSSTYSTQVVDICGQAEQPLISWPTPGIIVEERRMGDAPPGNGLHGSPSATQNASCPMGAEDTASDRHDSVLTLECWLADATLHRKPTFEAIFSPPWLNTDVSRPNGDDVGLMSCSAEEFETSLLAGLPTPNSHDTTDNTYTHNRSSRVLPPPPAPTSPTTAKRARPLDDEAAATAGGRDRLVCLCLQHVTFLVHELESAPTSCLDAGLALHKEAVGYGEGMLLCLQCSRRPENLTLLTFLAERLLRLGESIAKIFLQNKKTPVLDRPSVVVGEYEVDSPLEWETVLLTLIAQQLGAQKRLARTLKASAETLGSESVYRKAADTEKRASDLVETLLVNSVQFLRSSVE